MRRVYISAFGSGLGHATRMLSVARVIREGGDSVRFSSSGEAAALIRKEGYGCHSLPLVDVTWKEDGRFSALDTARSFPMMAGRFAKQVREETRNISSFGADVVLSDSMLSTVIASRLAKIKVVTVLNQLRLESSSRTPRVAASMISAGTISVGASLWGLSDAILLPDLPSPYTISQRSLWAPAGVKRKYIGFLTPPRQDYKDQVVWSLKREKRLKVYWQISGPKKTRVPLLARAFEVAQSMKEKVVSIISGGNPSGKVEPRRMPFGWFYEWCPVKDSMLEVVDLVVSRAGHTSIAQFILNERPSILVPIPQQTEQEGNALKAERLGIASRIDQLELTPRVFLEALTITRDKKTAKRLHDISIVARSLDALSEIMKEIRRSSR